MTRLEPSKASILVIFLYSTLTPPKSFYLRFSQLGLFRICLIVLLLHCIFNIKSCIWPIIAVKMQLFSLSFNFNLNIFAWQFFNLWFCQVSPSIGYLYLITGTCFTFLPACILSNANTIFGVRSKKPISLFQLSPHLQWNRPINCCFIFRPQLGQTRLLLISVPPAGWWKRPRRKCHTGGANLAHAPPRLG